MPDISLSFAFNTGPTAANGTASVDSRTGADKIGSVTVHFQNLRPMSQPMSNVPTTEIIVNSIPSFPSEAREACPDSFQILTPQQSIATGTLKSSY